MKQTNCMARRSADPNYLWGVRFAQPDSPPLSKQAILVCFESIITVVVVFKQMIWKAALLSDPERWVTDQSRQKRDESKRG